MRRYSSAKGQFALRRTRTRRALMVISVSAVETRVTISFGEGFGGDVAIQVGQVDRDRSRGGSSQTVEQVQRGGVQVKSEEVGLDAIIAQAVGHQFAFEFLVSVLGHRRFGGSPRSAYSS